MRRWLSAAAVLVLAALPAAGQGKSEIDGLIEQITTVGRKGAGNAEAAKAWKALVARGTPALVPILARINDADPTAANWLRPAFEAIAEKLGQDLPREPLEKFLADRRNPPAGRRLAYEWLVKLDKGTPARLLPTMLDDPSPELRRDAVARLIQAAKDLATDEPRARETYRRALKGAADPDQVDTIAAALDKLGEVVDRQAHLGVVRRWQLLAPFEHGGGVGWDRAYPPEKGVDLRATYKGKGEREVKWVEHSTDDAHGLVDLNKALAPYKGAVAYAYAVIDSPRPRVVELRAGCICGLKVFFNGKEVFAREEYHHGMRIDQYAVRVQLKAGRNTILLKVCQNEQTEAWAQVWQYQLRVCDPVGVGVPFTQPQAKEKRP